MGISVEFSTYPLRTEREFNDLHNTDTYLYIRSLQERIYQTVREQNTA